MNVRRFVGRNAREAMAQVRAAWGEVAVVLSNRPVPGGVEILAMPGTDVPPSAPVRAAPVPPEPMSTLSFQDFVRERQRLHAASQAAPSPGPDAPAAPREPGHFAARALALELATPPAPQPQPQPRAEAPAADTAMMDELRAMRAMLASQLAGLSWFDSVRRSPDQTQLLRLMVGNGFSPSVTRAIVGRLPADCAGAHASVWAMQVLSHNLRCAAAGEGLLECGGVHALVGPTGVGKTTTTAKLAARFALKHGPGSVGLITVDSYRMAAGDQLRAFGRLLNIPVHTARDGAALRELLDLFVGKKLVLIDTVGVGQRDRRVAELLAALPQERVKRLLVLSAVHPAETLDEVVHAYGAQPCSSCVITKLDEAARCAGVIDVAIRRRLVVEGFANGQRVPEDWHPPHAQLLAQKALLRPPAPAFTPDGDELALLFTAPADAQGVLRA